jgi:metal-sulfur cluster biosynthetic enzyme
VDRLVVAGWEVSDGEAVRRLRRMAYGIADWIVTETTAVTVELREAAGSDPPPWRPAEQAPPPPDRGEWRDPRVEHADALEPVLTALSSVIDPDLGINIVDLGFVRDVSLQAGRLLLRLTVTPLFCPLTSVIADQTHTALVGGEVVDDVAIEWVFQPLWTPADTTERARAELAAIGISWQ